MLSTSSACALLLERMPENGFHCWRHGQRVLLLLMSMANAASRQTTCRIYTCRMQRRARRRAYASQFPIQQVLQALVSSPPWAVRVGKGIISETSRSQRPDAGRGVCITWFKVACPPYNWGREGGRWCVEFLS